MAAADPAKRALEDERRAPLDRLAGEIAALEAWVGEAQAQSILLDHLPEIKAADRRVAEAEGRARAIECIGGVLIRTTP